MTDKQLERDIIKIYEDYEKRKLLKLVKLNILLEEKKPKRRKWYCFWK